MSDNLHASLFLSADRRHQADLAVIRNLIPSEYVQVRHTRARKSRERVTQLRWHEQDGRLTGGFLTPRCFRETLLQSFCQTGLETRICSVTGERSLQKSLELGLQCDDGQFGGDAGNVLHDLPAQRHAHMSLKHRRVLRLPCVLRE